MSQLDRFFDLAAEADVDGALDLTDELLAAGISPSRLIADVIVPTQVRVGRLWQTNEWSVVREHAATAVVDAVVGRLALARRPARDRAGRVVVVCAEGEWHTLSARLASVALRAQGWSVVFLGGSVPAAHLSRAARGDGWDTAVLTCSVPMFLPGARRSVEALHAHGIPVLATGSGFGPDVQRADRIGADAWARGPEDGLEVLEGWASTPPERLSSPALPEEAARLEATLPELVERTHALVARLWGRPLDLTGGGDLRDDVRTLLRFVLAGVVTDDKRVVDDFLDWLREVVHSRGIPEGTVTDLLDAALTAMPAELPLARGQLGSVA